MAVAESGVRERSPSAENSRRLNSWKEIADHFHRDVRTVQRWETKLGLPVHRRQHTRRGIVHAYESELDAWWNDGRKGLEDIQELPTSEHKRSVLWPAIAGLLLLAGGSFAWLYIRGQNRLSPFEVTQTRRITSTGRVQKAAISPDGRYIAYTEVASGQQSLLVRRTGTVHDIQILPPGSPYFLGLTFAPDSEAIYYVLGRPGGTPSELYRMPTLGGPTQRLKLELDSPVTFSPDGKKFAFVRETAGESSLIVADVGSGEEHRLFSQKLPLVLDYPAWSPDGRMIVCTKVDSSAANPIGSGARVVGVRVDDRREIPISTRTWPFIKHLGWLRDGHGIVLSARDQDTGLYHLWYVPYPEGNPRKITDGLNGENGVSLSGDSSRLLTIEERTLSGIWIMRSAGARDAQPVSPGSEDCKLPHWTAGGRIVYEHQLNGRRHVWSMAPDGTDRKQLTVEGANYEPSVSSDGRLLAFVSSRSGRPAIWTMDVDGRNPALVTQADGEPYPQLSPDGKWIAFTATGAGHWTTLRRVDAKGGRVVELNDKLWLQPSVSPNGKWIAGFYVEGPSGTQKYPDSIAVISSNGGQPSKVIPMPASVVTSAGLRWTADGRQLTYVEHNDQGANIWSQPLDGSPAHQVTQLRRRSLFSFDWSPEGTQIVLSQGVQSRDVVQIDSTPSQ
jgi:Tol biopolymer transport system component